MKKVKRIKLKVAKARAWKQFSLWIRLKNANRSGFVHCYTCNLVAHWKSLDAGHGIPGRNNAVLFMEEVVRPQCKQCNIFKHGNLAPFTRKLIKEHGEDKYLELVRKSEEIVQYKVEDFLRIEEEYRNRLESI